MKRRGSPSRDLAPQVNPPPQVTPDPSVLCRQGRDYPWGGCSRAFSWLAEEAASPRLTAPVCCLDKLLDCLDTQVTPPPPVAPDPQPPGPLPPLGPRWGVGFLSEALFQAAVVVVFSLPVVTGLVVAGLPGGAPWGVGLQHGHAAQHPARLR